VGQPLLTFPVGLVSKVGDPGGVFEQMLDLDPVSIGVARQMARHRIVQLQLPSFLQQQDRSGGECLGHRGDVEPARARVGDAQFIVRHAIALVELDPSSPAHQDHAGEVVAGDVGLHEAVDSLL
jgi:hypothetical protein